MHQTVVQIIIGQIDLTTSDTTYSHFLSPAAWWTLVTDLHQL